MLTDPATHLRGLLASPGLLRIPCCYDALSAALVEKAGFTASFMSGFCVSAARLGLPDTGLISYGEMLEQGRAICERSGVPVIGDGDTGYGNAMNVQRAVLGYAQAGFAGIMIEDQLSPKRCGHTRGKTVVSRELALERIRAAVDARQQLQEKGSDIVIVARTDARFEHGIEEAIWRAQRFSEEGSDILFIEAPMDREEMLLLCREVPGMKMANMLEQGDTPVLTPSELEATGFELVVYPLILLAASMAAMVQALEAFQAGKAPESQMSFQQLQELLGFRDYDARLSRLETL